MNGEVAVEASRPRPLSGGLWTLFSWLRKSEHSSSSETISSVGSDRTAASFDFLSPIYYPNSQPRLAEPITSPTDSYKKRLHERNLRRQKERDLTLRRKYGLWREEGEGYDGYSLPTHVHKNNKTNDNNRCRRAASECMQRRAAYVPGKRRAPLPPNYTTTSLPRNYKRKRPAPKPPLTTLTEDKENIETNPNSSLTNPSQSHSTKSNNFQDIQHKEIKLRTEKSFLKQIFDNKKRHSAIELSHIKLLPNISELDKQAAEIIETNKALRSNNPDLRNTECNPDDPRRILSSTTMWMCTKCLRKYNITIKTCEYCLNKNDELKHILNTSAASSASTQTDLNKNIQSVTKYNNEEKKQLKEMLKEMKHSLPKKTDDAKANENWNSKDFSTDAPTLRIGSIKNKIQVKKGDLARKDPDLKTKEIILNPSATPKVMVKGVLEEDKPKGTSKESPESLIRAIIATKNFNNPARESVNPSTSSNFVSKIIKSDCDKKMNEIDTEINASTVKKDNSNSNKAERHYITTSANKILSEGERKAIVLQKSTNDISQVQNSLRVSSLLNPNFEPKKADTENSQKNPVVESKETKHISVNCTKLTHLNPVIKANVNNKAEMNGLDIKEKSLFNPNYEPKKAFTEISQKNRLVDNVNCTNLNSVVMANVNKKPEINVLNNNEKSKPPTNKAALDPKTVSQIIKKSIEEKEKLREKKELCDVEKTKISDRNLDHSKRRDLINQLELSIAKGDEKAAADAAAKLAKLKLSCSVLSFSSQILAGPSSSKNIIVKEENVSVESNNIEEKNLKDEKQQSSENREKTYHARNVASSITKLEGLNKIQSIEVWIEDKIAARGPVRLNILRNSNVSDLKKEAATSLGIAVPLQRWIIGKTLCNDDNSPVISLAGPAFDVPFYLCLVESEGTKPNTGTQKEALNNSKENIAGDVYNELVKLEQQALVSNVENFECGVCIEECAVGNGVVLRECLHTFCKECLSDAVRHSEEPAVSCPAVQCPGVLQDREIRALLTNDDYEKWLARGLAAAESGTRNTFHCRTPDCSGWAYCEPGVRIFPCPVCKIKNCVPCQAIHNGETCEQYQKKLRETITAAESNNSDEGTQALLNSLISRGEALECPECRAIITKKWGCDWVKCSACKTEICWVTKGRRWGPAGRGDTSAGCRCGVDGKRCHPSCGYCH